MYVWRIHTADIHTYIHTHHFDQPDESEGYSRRPQRTTRNPCKRYGIDTYPPEEPVVKSTARSGCETSTAVALSASKRRSKGDGNGKISAKKSDGAAFRGKKNAFLNESTHANVDLSLTDLDSPNGNGYITAKKAAGSNKRGAAEALSLNNADVYAPTNKKHAKEKSTLVSTNSTLIDSKGGSPAANCKIGRRVNNGVPLATRTVISNGVPVVIKGEDVPLADLEGGLNKGLGLNKGQGPHKGQGNASEGYGSRYGASRGGVRTGGESALDGEDKMESRQISGSLAGGLRLAGFGEMFLAGRGSQDSEGNCDFVVRGGKVDTFDDLAMPGGMHVYEGTGHVDMYTESGGGNFAGLRHNTEGRLHNGISNISNNNHAAAAVQVVKSHEDEPLYNTHVHTYTDLYPAKRAYNPDSELYPCVDAYTATRRNALSEAGLYCGVDSEDVHVHAVGSMYGMRCEAVADWGEDAWS
jgi:hypothetical protein